MCMICTEESNKESMRINIASMIFEKNQEFKFKSFPEKCFKLCSYEDRKTDVKDWLNNNKRQYIVRLNKRALSFTKNISY